MKTLVILILASLCLFSGCIGVYQPNYIISHISPEEKATIISEESP